MHSCKEGNLKSKRGLDRLSILKPRNRLLFEWGGGGGELDFHKHCWCGLEIVIFYTCFFHDAYILHIQTCLESFIFSGFILILLES